MCRFQSEFDCELISGVEVSCVITRPEQNSNDDEKNDFHDGWLVTPMKSLRLQTIILNDNDHKVHRTQTSEGDNNDLASLRTSSSNSSHSTSA